MQEKERTEARRVLREKYRVLGKVLNERQRRLWAATEAKEMGMGGIACVSLVTGLSRTTIRAGIREIRAPLRSRNGLSLRIRKVGGGRKALTHHMPELKKALDRLIEPTTRGDPMSPLRWTCKSTRKLAQALKRQGYQISREGVARLLKSERYSLQGNRKTLEGKSHPDRDQQFHHINKRVKAARRNKQPVISVDTKKKELVGNYKNSGQEWSAQGNPKLVKSHDFKDPKLGKVIPYGVYDLSANNGWVSVGIDHDTADFAIETMWRWWTKMGRRKYPNASELTITADSGGSNSYRARAWKVGLQRLANKTGLTLRVMHFPPGTSKWNKIEHRLFSEITKNWRATPLVSRQAVVELIGNTKTKQGMKVRAELDTNIYPTGKKVSDAQLASILLKKDTFHGEWNYKVLPR